MKATPAQERYAYAVDALREALKTGEGPDLDAEDVRGSSLGYRRWKTFSDLLDTQKDLVREIEGLERRFTEVRPYLNGGNGYFDQWGLIGASGSKVDVLCSRFEMQVDAAVQAEMDYQEARS